MKRKLFLTSAIALLSILLLAIGFLAAITVTDYIPNEIEDIGVANNPQRIVDHQQPFNVITFNIGYGGMDRGQDFFMDGGKMSRSRSEAQTRANLTAVTSLLIEAKSDFYLLQEIDTNSSRSHYMNQAAVISQALPDYSTVFAYNYKVLWVPVPVLNPMGVVNSGLLTLSTYNSTSNRRFDLPGKESWPIQQLDLDRAFIESRYPVDNGKELVLINLHLSAFDKGGYIRKQQLDYLSNYLVQEQAKGSYIIVGGDWNHSLPGTNTDDFPAIQEWPEWLADMPESFQPEGFQWGVDKNVPTVRTADIPYAEGVNFRAVIDGFLVSSNVGVMSVHTADFHYENSDHNPVEARFYLK
ncbi:endonuclease/exonuclease/phosphatase family protein [Paenibacillus sp. GCM10012307]|uniref:Endonuclease/exonuclease/phosphatase family protein n=1 Tax=Paenibacillus roseus TaxID=2798579 RepID=A0A934IXR3_9BACL|nr:endonuclease/exonuclease/phosphatase family protein [Paenibacillus roseus]MBJ6361202.1 endonuclease/exonuclease/phosphatase family protein [Paenibacillus roseus]